MKLNKLLEGLEIKESVNDLNLDITNIHSDSRKIKQNGLFIAIDGYSQNGIDYLDAAINKRCYPQLSLKIILISQNFQSNITYIKAGNTRKALAVTSCNLYDNPSKNLNL